MINQFRGNQLLLEANTCVLLNSRQSKRPCRLDPWVDVTFKAAQEMINRNLVIITSVGLNTWELALHSANILGGRQIIILPISARKEPDDMVNQIVESFQLDEARCCFVCLNADNAKSAQDKAYWQERDRYAAKLAQTVVPICIRKKGFLAALVELTKTSGKSTVDDYCVDYGPASDRVEYDFGKVALNPIFHESSWDSLVHWTRSSHHPCPEETHFSYYNDVLNSTNYPRSAYHILAKIARSQRLQASSRFILGGYSVISFSALNPVEAIRLMRWRRRYVYYSFEPYGIAIERKSAIELGIRPVTYGESPLYYELAERDRPFFQNIGSSASDWKPEAEWRHLGDLDLSSLPASSIKLIVYTAEEANDLAGQVPFEVLSLTV